MKKRLLFAFAMLLSVAAGFAQSVGDYVYTRDGKYKITSDVKTGIVTSDLAGWSVISATAGTTCAEQFTYLADEAGICSMNAAATEGISYSLAGIDPSGYYVVTFTVAQPSPAQTLHRSTHTWLCDHISGDANDNVLSIIGTNMENAEDVVEYAVPTELMPGEAQNYSFAITPSDVARNYAIQLKGWATDLVIKDIKVQSANPVGDERTIAPLLDHAEQLLSLREWEESDELEGLQENIEYAKECIGNPDIDIEELAGAVEALNDAVSEFQSERMDDQIPATADKILLAPAKVQKVNNIGVWEGFSGGAGRIHANQGEKYDVGHYAGNTKWGFGKGCNGLTTKMELQPGSYIFSMEQRAVSREKGTSTCWDENQGLSCAYAVMYVRPVGDATAEANIVETDAEYEKSIAVKYAQYNLPANKLEKHTISFVIEEAGTYEFAVKTYAQEHYKDVTNGGTFEPYNAQIYGKTNAQYSKAQYDYEEDVRAQIAAARDNLTKAAQNLADETMPWGRPELQAAIEEFEPVTAKYEALTQDEIIATYDKSIYDSSKGLEAINEDESTEEEPVYYRLMASEVYRNAAKGIIAANKAFQAKNDTLASLNNAVANAESTLKFRIYDTATAKATLQAKIAEAKALDTQMRATEYSEENAQQIVAAIEAINQAIEELKTSIPPSSITLLADIDFEAAPAGDVDFNTTVGEATFTGNVGSMTVSDFANDISVTDFVSQIGIFSNGENIRPGILRLGKSEGITTIEAPADGFSTDIVRVSMDWWFGSLSGKHAGFYLLDENEANVGGFYHRVYNGDLDGGYDPTGILAAGGRVARGSSTQSNEVICEDGNLTHLEYIIDYGNKVAYAVSTLPTKVVTTECAVLENSNPIVKFMIKSDYNNNDRRCWFDNLKIERIAADPSTANPEGAGIHNVAVSNVNAAKIYTLSGVQVNKTVKGVYIMNGKKVVVK